MGSTCPDSASEGHRASYRCVCLQEAPSRWKSLFTERWGPLTDLHREACRMAKDSWKSLYRQAQTLCLASYLYHCYIVQQALAIFSLHEGLHGKLPPSLYQHTRLADAALGGTALWASLGHIVTATSHRAHARIMPTQSALFGCLFARYMHAEVYKHSTHAGAHMPSS